MLGKKSWNVYAPANIERVKRDEAAAAAHEEEADRRLDEYDAERRIATLRGQRPPSPPPDFDPEADAAKSRRRHFDTSSSGRERKRRRITGEDDTDRDIRLAKEDADAAADSREVLKVDSKRPNDTPLHDHEGHINLFPVDARAAKRAEKNVELEAEKKKKEKEFEDQYTMRFENAAGKGGVGKPWYAEQRNGHGGAEEAKDQNNERALLVESKDVWGNKDPRRRERAQMRMSASDPLAFMKKAQTQLKDSERDRATWKRHRDKEAGELEKLHEFERRQRRSNKPIGDGDDGLERFSLNAPWVESNHDRSRQGRHRSTHRREQRSRSRERRGGERHYHGRRRSRSPDKQDRSHRS